MLAERKEYQIFYKTYIATFAIVLTLSLLVCAIA